MHKNSLLLRSNTSRKRKLDIALSKKIDLDVHSVTTDKIIEILKKEPARRSLEDFTYLNFYCLNKSKLYIKFSKENIDKSSYEKIILLSQASSKYQKIEKSNTIIYNIDDESEYLYIILRGTVKIMKLEKITRKMQGNAYFKLLINYRNNKEYFLCSETIKKNSAIFPVNEKDLPILEKILLKIYLFDYEIEINNDDLLEVFVHNAGLDYSFFNIESYRNKLKKQNLEIKKYNDEKIKQNNYFAIKDLLEYDSVEAKINVMQNIKIISQYIEDIPKIKCENYRYFIGITEANISFYKFEQDKNLSWGDYFGDSRNGKYIHTVISTSDDLELYLMKNNFLNQYINTKLVRNTQNQISCLLKNYFFAGISSYNFEKYFYNLFELDHYSQGEKLCQENEPVNNIFFIKSGQIKLFTNKSIKEIHAVNNIIIEKIKQKHIEKMNEGNTNSENDNEEEINKLPKYRLDLMKITKELETKQNLHIITYQENQCIGFETFYYGLNYLYSAVASSDNVDVFRLSVKDLMEIFERKNEKSYLDFCVKAEKTMLFLINRFIQAMNIKLKFYENKYEPKAIEITNNNKPMIKNHGDDSFIYKKTTEYLPYLKEKNKSQKSIIKIDDISNSNKNNIILKKLNALQCTPNTSRISENSLKITKNLVNNLISQTSRRQNTNYKKIDEFLIKRLKKIKQVKNKENFGSKFNESSIKKTQLKSDLHKRNNSAFNLKCNNIFKYLNHKKLTKIKKNSSEKSKCHFYSVNNSFHQNISQEMEKKSLVSYERKISRLNMNNLRKYLMFFKKEDYKNIKDMMKTKLEE